MYDPLSQTADPPLSLISTRRVENVFPTVEVPYRLAIIGEAPGAEEEAQGLPFVGPSGRLLDSILSSVGVMRQGCFVGNICKYRPPNNEIKSFGFNHEKVQEGWAELQTELKTYDPYCILSLGATPLHFITGRSGITSWRGSILSSSLGKVVPAIHPAAVLRDYKQWILLRFDALRARQEAETKELSLPQRLYETELTSNEICSRLDNWPTERECAFDIEGGIEAFSCCALSDMSSRGFVIAWTRYTKPEQARIAVSLSRLLYRTDIRKVLQTSLYDRFVLAYSYNLLIRNVVDDTMVKHWEIYPESSTKDDNTTKKKKAGLGKGLAVIASIWTREPYWKDDSMYNSTAEGLYLGNIKDTCVTHEANRAMSQSLSGQSLRHYRFNMGLLSPLLYMELRGISYDSKEAQFRLNDVQLSLHECSSRLAVAAGYDLTGSKGSISATKLKRCLYHEKGYPEQKIGRGPQASVTTNVDALLKLKQEFPYDTFLSDILLHRKMESLQETLSITADPDERVRCAYNLVGTETGRLTCYTSPTGSGANLQTITKKLRKLYVADEGYWMFQCDLSGADGWTVAAHCLRHGDSTMWDDYTFGLKPARIVALFYEHPEYIHASREELKATCKELVDDNGWLYFTSKRVQHATNYGVKEKTLQSQVMADSYKISGSAVYVKLGTIAALQRVYLARYTGLFAWHEWAKREVFEGRNLTSASGHTRTFLGRRRSWNAKTRSFAADHETWKEFLADEPQENTTYATNKAFDNLWNDPENRMGNRNGGTYFRVEPLHHNHDAMIGQFLKTDTEWATLKISSWFNNKLIIAGMEVVIPFEGHYGRSWGELTEGVI